jgi:hypothetical protein
MAAHLGDRITSLINPRLLPSAARIKEIADRAAGIAPITEPSPREPKKKRRVRPEQKSSSPTGQNQPLACLTTSNVPCPGGEARPRPGLPFRPGGADQEDARAKRGWRPRRKQPTTIEELLERVVVCMSGCWIWAGGDSGSEGRGAHYGRILRPGTRNAMAAHRYVYQTFVGKIPPGYHVDHKCHLWGWHPYAHRRCVNPDHLEAIPFAVNMARRDYAAALTRELFVCEPLPPPQADNFAHLCAPGERLADLAF